LRQLREGGVQVDLAQGDLERRCRRQNNGFRKAVVAGLPFVTYKYAMTLDGRIAADSGDSRWISGPESRKAVHAMRARADAVMVGVGTMLADNPLLTAREAPCSRQPLRVVVDPRLVLLRESQLVQSLGEGPVLAVCSTDVSGERIAEVASWGVEVSAVPGEGGRPSPTATARMLAARGIQGLLLEGGATLAGAWWEAGLIDQAVVYIAPRLLSGEALRSPLKGPGSKTVRAGVGLQEIEVRTFGEDVCVSGYVTEVY